MKIGGAPHYPCLIGLPVLRRPLFPGHVHPYQVKHPDVLDAIIKAKEEGNPYLGVFLRKDSAKTFGSHAGHEAGAELVGGDESYPELITDPDEIYHVGALAQVHHITSLETGAQLLLSSRQRIKFSKVVSLGPPLQVEVESSLVGDPYDASSDVIKAYCQEILATIRDLVKLNPLLRENITFFTQTINMQDPFLVADFAATITTADGHDLQAVLEEMNVEERLRMALELISKERELSRLQKEIQKQVEEKMTLQQRNYFLMEQMKSIKKELGLEKDDKEALLNKFRERMEACEDLGKDARKAMEEELEKLSSLEKNSQEFNTTRNYLDWLTCLPWGKTSQENFDLKRAKQILDEDHYGLDDIKQRILEFIAVGKLRGTVHGKILCFAGPPGVGKTSIGQSIARALNREFFRFSVGGLTDIAEIKGHRRTYVGAMPGKLIQALKTSGTTNPLILIDEVDKLGRGYQGDPASALLEVLDPSQNSAFVDHYLDVPVDLSKALFICTANVMDTIPGPLRDRMETIWLSGYDLPEKVAISEQYLIPKALEEGGLAEGEGVPESLKITSEAVESLIRWYCREAGVRNLEKHIAKVVRKLALEVVKTRELAAAADATSDSGDAAAAATEAAEPLAQPVIGKTAEEDAKLLERQDWAVTPDNLSDYVGKPVFTSDRLYEEALPPGVVMGLAWTALGGTSLYIETSAVLPRAAQRSSNAPKDAASTDTAGGSGGGGGGGGGGSGALRVTGQLGGVMVESSQIAHHFARRELARLAPANDFLERAEVHMHVPEGATPKDGPSAGVTMATALLSLALARPVRADVAMTGEVSLTGKVLPVGGIKEKTIAARRAGVHCLVFPKGNRRDYDELPDYLKDGLDVHFAATYVDVYKVAFAPQAAEQEAAAEAHAP
ncbi:putative lon protease [Tribonema minus]|uniref:Lon protease homolog n=1 Tax=Tribonema minus TaxID=303371 RepID=A0A835YRA9_9STRA|nr:putative lon protease [Tribonema minus]